MFRLGAQWRVPEEPEPDVTAELAPLRESTLLELADRHRAAVDKIDELMKAETARGALCDKRVHNALLEVRLKLEPGTQTLPLRPTPPVIPGRAS